MIKIILADDHLIFLDGIKSLLSETADITIVDAVTSGEQLLETLKSNSVDIVITDITMKGLTGIEVAKKITEDYPEIKVIILSMHINEEFVINSAKAGAVGYLPKDTSSEELLTAIRTIYEGGHYYSKDVSDFFLHNYIKKLKTEQTLIEKDDLTIREIEILKLAATGLTNKEIANQLFISVKTVDSHKNHIMQKLKLKNSAELVLYTIKNKLIDL